MALWDQKDLDLRSYAVSVGSSWVLVALDQLFEELEDAQVGWGGEESWGGEAERGRERRRGTFLAGHREKRPCLSALRFA